MLLILTPVDDCLTLSLETSAVLTGFGNPVENLRRHKMKVVNEFTEGHLFHSVRQRKWLPNPIKRSSKKFYTMGYHVKYVLKVRVQEGVGH